MSKLLNKLKKLIAHEESARSIGNIAEAAAFASKIQDILASNNLSMSDVEIHAAQASEIDCDLVVSGNGNFNEWQKMLASTVCNINGCSALFSQAGLIFVGRKIDRKIAFSLYCYFENLGLELGEKYKSSSWGNSGYLSFSHTGYSYSENTPEISEKELNSYLMGFIVRVSERLTEDYRKNNQENINPNALVFLSRKTEESSEFAEKVFNPEAADLPSADDVDIWAFRRGMIKGDQIALTDKVIE